MLFFDIRTALSKIVNLAKPHTIRYVHLYSDFMIGRLNFPLRMEFKQTVGNRAFTLRRNLVNKM